MNLTNQIESLQELKTLAESDRHSILIAGPSGCGKSFLAKEYAKFIGTSDSYVIEPNVKSIKELSDKCYETSSVFVVCIENLDLGSVSASYALLKLLEEPMRHVYIVVTCRNMYNIPETIISRSCVVNVPNVSTSDIEMYIKSFNLDNLTDFKDIFKNLRDIEEFSKLDSSKIEYMKSMCSSFEYKGTVSDIVWKLGHYPDNSNTNLPLMLNCIVHMTKEQRIRNYAIECVKSLSESRLSTTAILSKFAFDCKYTY